MAQNYTRQSTLSDGDTITASLFNDEYNQLVNAFTYSSTSASSTGHRHDGSAGQGGNIFKIGDLDFLNKIEVDSTNNRWGFYVEVSSAAVEQIRIQDGAIVPVTDNDIDLGTSSLEFKDLFIDGTAHIDTLDVDANATVAGTLGVTGATTLSSTLAVTGTTTLTGNVTTTNDLSVGGNLTVTGTTTFNGGTITMGDAATDNVVFGADVDSHIIPDDDDTYDLGSTTQQWRNLYIDGTAEIDTLSLNGTNVTATATEINLLDGVTATTAELNILDGVTSTATELNLLDGVTATTAELNYLDITTLGTVEASKAVTADSGGHVTFPDGKQLRLGASDDLKIYHNSSNGNSIIAETGAGALSLHTNGSEINFYDSGNARQLASFTTAGATTFRHNGNIKLSTTATGADVVGTLVADGLTVEKSASRHLSLSTDTRGDGNGSVVCVDGSSSNLRNIDIEGQQVQLATNAFDQTASIPRVRVATNGDVSFYEDTGTTAKLFWDASAERLGIGTSSPSATLDVEAGNEAVATFNRTASGGSSVGSVVEIQRAGTLAGHLGSQANGYFYIGQSATNLAFSDTNDLIFPRGTDGVARDGAINLGNSSNRFKDLYLSNQAYASYFGSSSDADTYMRFAGSDVTLWNNGGSESMRIDSSGNVGIGTTSPSVTAEISSATIHDQLRVHRNISGDNTTAGTIQFAGNDSTGNVTDYARIKGLAKSDNAGSEDGHLVFETMLNASISEAMRIDENGKLGIGTTTPAGLLSVHTGTDSSDILALSGGNSGRYLKVQSFATGAGFSLDATSSEGVIALKTVGTERLRVANDGKVGIGTSSPTAPTDIRGANSAVHGRGQLYLSNTETAAANAGSQISFGATYSGTTQSFVAGVAGRKENSTSGNYAGYLQFSTRPNGGNNTERMRITSAGNVGIGTSSPSRPLHVNDNDGIRVGATASYQLDLKGAQTPAVTVGGSTLASVITTSGTGSASGHIGFEIPSNDANDGFYVATDSDNDGTVDTLAMKINASGKVGIGTSSLSEALTVLDSGSYEQLRLMQNETDNSDQRMGLTFRQYDKDEEGYAGILGFSNSTTNDVLIGGGTGLYNAATNIRFLTGSTTSTTTGSEAMRITNGGHLLVSKTAQDQTNTVGFEAKDTGLIAATTDGGIAGLFNRKTSDGAIIEFRKNNTGIGSIGVNESDIYIGVGDTTIRFADGADAVIPRGSSGVLRDGAITLGNSANRFKDLYLSNAAKVGSVEIEGSSIGLINLYRNDVNANYAGITFKDTTNTNINGKIGWGADQLRLDGTDEIIFSNDDTEAMRIDSSGNLLIDKTAGGTTNIGTQISGDGYTAIVNTNNNIPLYLENKATNGNCRISFRNDSHGGASFGLNNGGDFTIFDTTASTTRFNVTSARVLNASGGLAGIALGGSGSANILDDYEEGTWTPTFSRETTAPVITTGTVTGRYTKVGRLVQATFYIQITSVTSSGAGINTMSLPFSAVATEAPSLSFYRADVFASSITGQWSSQNTGGTTVRITQLGTDGSVSSVSSDLNTGYIIGQLVYEAA